MNAPPFEQKIFGLGLSKTGTSSLSEALNKLGIKTIHYPFDTTTYQQLREGKYQLSILEEYQGIVDIPVVPFFAQLDKQYPGSKFIHTIREKESWLKSVEMHWKLLMEWWKNFPEFKKFHEFISACVYGIIEFNRDRFWYVYETNNRNILHYFKDRPQDLLVINICNGEGWKELCAFLQMPVPDAAFPHANEWMHKLILAMQDFTATVPDKETFILIDLDGFGSGFSNGRNKIPFMEKDGQYNGQPANDEEALRELRRLQQQGAKFLVIGWPAFWWLDYYSGFAKFLNENFPVILKNELLMIFELH